jgi:hypothetical protein
MPEEIGPAVVSYLLAFRAFAHAISHPEAGAGGSGAEPDPGPPREALHTVVMARAVLDEAWKQVPDEQRCGLQPPPTEAGCPPAGSP